MVKEGRNQSVHGPVASNFFATEELQQLRRSNTPMIQLYAIGFQLEPYAQNPQRLLLPQ